MTSQSKRERLRELAQLRVQTRWVGYTHPEDYGYHFSDVVSPYSRTAGNVDAAVMLVLQDWTSDDFQRKQGYDPDVAQFGYTPHLRTNVRLKQLLQRHLNLRLEDTYGTNLFPFIKPGRMSSKIPNEDLVRAAKLFTWPQIEIINPRAVLVFGKDTAKALRTARPEHNSTLHFYELPHPAARIRTAAMDEAWQKIPL